MTSRPRLRIRRGDGMLLALCLAFSSCVSLDQLPPGSVPASASAASKADTSYPDPDGGFASATSAHFTLKGYSQNDLESLKSLAETIFTKISSDVGLYTFLASQSFTLVVYRDRDEFIKKTNQPEWASVVTAGNTIYLYYPNTALEPVLAHHLTHLILRSYMADKTSTYRWLDEGLAMHEEVLMMSESDRTAYQSSKDSQLRQNRMAFSQMSFFVTNTEERRRTDAWYQQVESVVTYLLAQGSPLAFAQFLSELRVVEIDRAISDAYPAKFRSFNDLEAAWKYTI